MQCKPKKEKLSYKLNVWTYLSIRQERASKYLNEHELEQENDNNSTKKMGKKYVQNIPTASNPYMWLFLEWLLGNETKKIVQRK